MTLEARRRQEAWTSTLAQHIRMSAQKRLAVTTRPVKSLMSYKLGRRSYRLEQRTTGLELAPKKNTAVQCNGTAAQTKMPEERALS